jgi:hypothetical protein
VACRRRNAADGPDGRLPLGLRRLAERMTPYDMPLRRRSVAGKAAVAHENG